MLTAAEALACLAAPSSAEDWSPLNGSSPLVIDLASADPALPLPPAVARALRELACASVAFCPAAQGADSPLARAADLVVIDSESLATVEESVARNPIASLVLVQSLRAEGRSLHEALVAESLAYSTLQAGPEFARWLAQAGEAARGKPTDEGDSTAAVEATREGELLRLELNRPQRHNAFSTALRDALAEVLAVVVADDSIARVELRGRGPCFSSGGDLAEFGTLDDPATAHAVRSTRNVGRLLAACGDRVTAFVHGHNLGAGVELPAFAGRVVARADTSFALPELEMGLLPGAGGTASLPARIGRQRTAWLALSGVTITAQTALDWGLVDEICNWD